MTPDLSRVPLIVFALESLELDAQSWRVPALAAWARSARARIPEDTSADPAWWDAIAQGAAVQLRQVIDESAASRSQVRLLELDRVAHGIGVLSRALRGVEGLEGAEPERVPAPCPPTSDKKDYVK